MNNINIYNFNINRIFPWKLFYNGFHSAAVISSVDVAKLFLPFKIAQQYRNRYLARSTALISDGQEYHLFIGEGLNLNLKHFNEMMHVTIF